jgi:hypothetical protein
MGFLPPGLRPAWSGSGFLLYLGAFVVLVSLGVLLGTLGEMDGAGGLAGWSALFLALLLALTVAARRDGRSVVAGLCAFVALFALAVLVGSLLEVIGLADDVAPFDRDFELAPLVLEVVVLVAALYAARELRFPLLLLVAVAAKTVLVLDTVAGVVGTGNWIVWAALLLGIVELALAISLDDDADRRPWGFWKHAVAALLIGGALLSLLDGGDFGWVLIALVSLGFLGIARSTDRSVWAIVGAVGLFLVTTHFVDESATLFEFVPLPFDTADEGLELWQTALVYMGLGVVYVLLGGLLRQRTLHDEATPG